VEGGGEGGVLGEACMGVRLVGVDVLREVVAEGDKGWGRRGEIVRTAVAYTSY